MRRCGSFARDGAYYVLIQSFEDIRDNDEDTPA